MAFTTKNRLLTTLACSVIGIIIIVSIYSKTRPKHLRTETPMVSTALTQQHDITITTNVSGSVEPHLSVAIKSLVDGHIINVGFKEGDFVKAGQTLFTIDQRPFVVKLNAAQANLTRDTAKAVAASSALERNSKLLPFGYISKQEFTQLQADSKVLAATVQSDQAALTDAQLQLSYCNITAPADGRTGSLLVNTGSLVKANDQTPLVTLNQITPIDVKFSIPEKQLFAVKESLTNTDVMVEAYLEENPTIKKSGKLVFIDNTVDSQSGMIMLKASFPNYDQYFWPGQFVKINLPLTTLHQAITIPTRAVQMGQDGAYVFTINAAHQAIMQPVTLGPTVGDNTVINNGLQPNILVVTEGQSFLSNGVKVRLQS